MAHDSSKAVEAVGSLEPAVEPDELGRLGPYRVLELLGTGGMGHVFRAEDTRLRRPVALKVMNKGFAAGPGSRRRFLEEARSMAAVDHDNVVTIYEVGERQGTPFLAMELLKGATLEERLDAGESFNVERTIRLAVGVCHGLQAAHDRGLVHRDVKPGNIWIESPSGRPKLLDFGLALATGPIEQIAGAGSVTGTPGYLSPEQARVEPLDNRSDLYSLGVVLFEICTGQLPFVVKPAQRMLIAVIADPPPVVHDLNSAIPVPLSDLIGSLLSKESRDRPASAQTLAALLEAVGEQVRGTAENSPSTEQTAAPQATPVAALQSLDSPATAGRRWGWMIGAAALVLVLLTVLLWLVKETFFSGPVDHRSAGQLARPAFPHGRRPIAVEWLQPLHVESFRVPADPLPVERAGDPCGSDDGQLMV